MKYLLEADCAHYLYSGIHSYLQKLGDVIGNPLYALGNISATQHVSAADIAEETLAKKNL